MGTVKKIPMRMCVGCGEMKPKKEMIRVLKISDDGFIDDIEQKTDWNGSSEIYSNEDLQAAVDTIINTIENEWQVEVEVNEVFYEGDETATANLPYCQSFNPEITECAVFSTNFHIPEQDVEMA